MPHTQARGPRTYVLNRNPQNGAVKDTIAKRPEFEALKVNPNLPQTSVSNHGPRTTVTRQSKRQDAVDIKPTDTRGTLYETDTPSIDGTISTGNGSTEDVKKEQESPSRRNRSFAWPSDAEGSAPHFSIAKDIKDRANREPRLLGEDRAEDDESHGQSNKPLDLANHEVRLSTGLNGPRELDLPHLPGDSYPDTTSGGPSISETDDEHKREEGGVRRRSQGIDLRFHSLPSRGGSRNPATQSNVETHDDKRLHTKTSTQHVVPEPWAHEPHVTQMQYKPIAELSSGFSYAKGPDVKSTLRHPLPPSYTGDLQLGGWPESSQQAQEGSNAQSGHDHQPSLWTRRPRHEDQVTMQALAPNAILLHPAHGQEQQPRESLPRESPPAHFEQTLPASGHFSEADEPRSSIPASADPVESIEDVTETAIQMDYSPDQLAGMDFTELKNMSFDADPNATGFHLPRHLDTDDLRKKLEIVCALSLRDQGDFFGSLSIDEWDEAGDWFVERFMNILERIKIARREKRKASQDLEREIEARYNAVSRKRQLTDAAMVTMKENGGRLLQATPGRNKKMA